MYEHAPFWTQITEQLLRGGTLSHGIVLSKALELCRQESGNCTWPDIPEKYWERALQVLA